MAPEPELPQPPDVRPWTAGAAAAALDADGRFVLPDPVSPGPDAIVERPFAAALALAFIRTWVANPDGGATQTPGDTTRIVSIRDYIEERHGGPIDWSNIRLEPRLASFADTPYEPLPDPLQVPYRRLVGPKYLVPVYEGQEQVMSLSVAAYSTDVAIDERGYVDLPPVYGNEFFPLAGR